MSPTPQQVQVATSTLRNEAKTWDEQSEAMQRIADKASELRFDNRVEAGMFQLIVSPYNEVSDQVKQRSAEGKTEMAAVASALRAVARAYEENEEEHAEEIMSLV